MHRFGKQTLPELERFLKPQSFLLKQLQDDVLSHADRVRIGIKLSEFGDTREGVGLTSAGLPDIRWVTIPPGRVRLDGIEHIFEVKSFRMAKYLVTNAQFGAFIRTEDSYGHADWWKDISNPYWRITPRTPRWPEANCPRMVSWYEAIAFCRWLSARTGTTIRLPAEWEWQQAATGGDPTRHYPWPGGWDAARCSHSSVYEDRITAVGMYPSGASQQGVLDMAGNVWEWCMNQSDQPERSWALHINSHNNRAIRGGSLYDKPEHLRTSHREGQTPTSQDHLIGVRLVQDIP
jgi:formylglycine-generating enzyme required for sulfatase activity